MAVSNSWSRKTASRGWAITGARGRVKGDKESLIVTDHGILRVHLPRTEKPRSKASEVKVA